MVWHLLSCLGGVFAIVHNAFLRKEKLSVEKDPRPALRHRSCETV
jgi:hypothetical protein